jgi:carotenoid cleavage dioxygenase
MGGEIENGGDKKRQQAIVKVEPNPQKGLLSAVVDFIEKAMIYVFYKSPGPNAYLSGAFRPVDCETPPCPDLPVIGSLPV